MVVVLLLLVVVGFCDNNAHPSSLALFCLGLINPGLWIWLSEIKKICKSIGNWIPKLGKTWWSYYEIFCILANYYFQPIINYLTFQKPTWLTIPRELWPKRILSDIFIWRSPNVEIFTCEIVPRRQIAIWGLRSTLIEKL